MTDTASPRQHEFHAWPWTFGPYGSQEVHVHSCISDGHGPNDAGPAAGCAEVLIGWGRECEGIQHRRANLDDKASVSAAIKTLRPQAAADSEQRWKPNDAPSPFFVRHADALYEACAEAIASGRIDARSKIGDAALDYRDERDEMARRAARGLAEAPTSASPPSATDGAP